MGIKERVHELYWGQDMNCARTTLLCLGELLEVEYPAQTLQAAIGLHGAGGFRAQCGLVEGRFGSLSCRELRPNGFTEKDPPHLCETLTCEAIAFTYDFIKMIDQEEPLL